MRLHLGALILTLIGLVFLSIDLDLVPIDLDLVPVDQLRTLLAAWWPLVLILVGVAAMARPRRAD